MSIQSSLNSITKTTLKGAKTMGTAIKSSIDRFKESIGIDAEVGKMAMERMQKQRDSITSQRNILTGGNDGSENT